MMKSFKVAFTTLMMLTAIPVLAENFTVKGDMASTIHYELKHQITAGDSMRKLMLSFVVPESFDSPTYKQQIANFKVRFSPEAEEKTTTTDARGNKIIEATWSTVPRVVDATISFDAQINTGLKPIQSSAPFPPVSTPGHLKDYLRASEQVQTDDPAIRELSLKLTKGVKTQFDAVQKVVSWVVDNIRYVNPPVQYDALYSLQTGKGNCQNFSHLTAALLRNVGVPVRIVNGVTMHQPFDVSLEKGTLTFKMGQGRHSWVEVWFPDLGWVPYDPMNMQFFISNRFVRINVGADNNETKNDGLVRFVQNSGARTNPTLQETIGGNFLSDSVKVLAQRHNYGPKNLLLGPNVLAGLKETDVQPTLAPVPVSAPPIPASPVSEPAQVSATPLSRLLEFVSESLNKLRESWGTAPPRPAPPAPVPPKEFVTRSEMQQAQAVALAVTVPAHPVPELVSPAPVPPEELLYNVPFVFGNLEFPENVDFAFPRVTETKGKNSFEMSRNFLVETAEFVTHNVTQYAQVVELTKPVTLHNIELALHNFGGEGHLWVDVFKDYEGQPGEIVCTTQMIALEEISSKPGYRWVTFNFRDKGKQVLKPGSYWIALGFSGKPVVNWFYTYGKPVGPVYGTRYKSIFAKEWSGALNYEFNYKVVGMTVK
jgi:transglutaminase-like putative cysteine protease